jgi:maltose O-acetyltransferase
MLAKRFWNLLKMIDMLRFLIGRLMLLIVPDGRFPGWNRYALRLIGGRIGSRAIIYSSIRVSRRLKLVVGTESFIGSRSVFVGGVESSVSIGSHCDISDNVHFVTGTHEIDSVKPRTAGKGYSKDIVVGNGVWIGYNVLVLPGVTVGDKAIIAAGTVGHKDVAARSVVAGNPMKLIREL